jgi:hypothetical protein
MRKIFTRAQALLLAACFSLTAHGQQSNLSCSQTNIPFVNNRTPAFTVTQSTDAVGGLLTGNVITVANGWIGASNVIDANLTGNAAIGTLVGSGSVTLRVSDATNDYNAGNFAGFVLSTGGLLNLNVLGSITIRTYLNNAVQETKTGSSLIGLGSSLISGASEVGFYTNLPYDAVEVSISSTLGLASYNVYYAFMQGTGSCTSPALACNANTRPTFPTFAAVVTPEHTGVTGALAVGDVANPGNLVDADTTNFASIVNTITAIGSASVAVKDVSTTYPAGTYAGFDIDNPNLANVALLSNLALVTYNNGVFQEQKSGTGLLVGATVLSSGSRQKVGFVTTLPFDEVQLVITQPGVGISLGTTRVYNAILKQLCAGPALACNTATPLNESVYPVLISLDKTGIAGVACVNCRVDSTGNLLDGNPATGATINLTANVIGSGSIAVKDALTTYPAGTFAGFDIESPALLDVSVLSNFTVTTYNDGTLQETFSGTTLVAGVSTGLLGTSGRLTVGGVSTLPFDELRLTANQATATVTLGTTKVYGVNLVRFCDTALSCSRNTYWLNTPGFPVYVDGAHTGISGLACAACNVTNTPNVISADTTDYAVLSPVANIGASVSVSVHDAIKTYPAGTIAGYAIADLNNLLQVNLLRSLTIRTYNNGVLQESRSAGQLLNLSALILQVNPVTGYYNIGFTTSLPFDEIQISATPLASVLPIIRVYGAFIDTRYVTGGGATGGTICVRPPLAKPDYLATLLNTAVTGNLQTNDLDPQNQSLTYSSTPAQAPANGTVVINADGTFTYTPSNAFIGVDSFRYTVCNTSAICTSQWVYVSVLPSRTPGSANRPPHPQSDLSQTFTGTPVSGNASSNDTDPDGNPLTYTIATPPAHGVLTLNPNGQYTYKPDSSYTGTDSAFITVCDNGTPALCRGAVLRLIVTPDPNPALNDAPNAYDEAMETPAGKNVSGSALANDSDPNGHPITATVLDAVDASKGTLYFAADGGYTFVPASGFTGNVAVRYQVCDNQTPALCATATLNITVVPLVGPDFTPTIVFDSTSFDTSAAAARDFLLTIANISASSSNSPIVVKVLKPSAFTITYAPGSTTSAVNGTTTVSNGDWTITENGAVITCQLNANVVLPGNTVSRIGFRIARKPNTALGTQQNITATIVSGSGGDSNSANNQYTIKVSTR